MGKKEKLLLCTSWKMNLSVFESIKYAEKLINFVDKAVPKNINLEIFIFPDFLSLYPISLLLKSSRIKLGAQDCFWEDKGAFTGEVSPLFLADIDCSYVMAGHPERVKIFHEDLEIINKKVKAILRNNLTPILFVVENEKKENINLVCNDLKEQLFPALKGIEIKDLNKIVIIYEPAWAIGTGSSAPVEHTHEILSKLRDALSSEYGQEIGQSQLFMYGGGVTLDSAKDIMQLENINGLGMGKAGLNFEFFTGAIKTAVELLKN